FSLAASGGKATKGGIGRGRITNFVGDGSAGKTAITLEICAQTYYFLKNRESNIWPTPKKIDVVYNNKEGVMDFPVVKMWGKEFNEAVIWTRSEHMEQCGRDILRRIKALKKGECLLYVIDSLDAYDAKKARERSEKSIKTDKEADNTMGMEKPKYLSREFFPSLCSALEDGQKDATIIIISQVRDNIGAGMFEKRYKRQGGKAMDFYTHMVCWLAVVTKLTKEVTIGSKKKKIPYGVTTKAQFSRNKCATSFRDVDIDILFANKYTPARLGAIDDIGSMVKFMGYRKDTIPEWSKKKKQLIKLVKKKWNDIEKSLVQEREEVYPK
ncbi:hypothetical protein HN682_00955, partial [Candidatus Peregrinibacteria bacterium]|nr:hypothetical protein [Candidatus Peregrinibacteria bacterium]